MRWEMRCVRCGGDLFFEVRVSGPGDLVFSVFPCDHCAHGDAETFHRQAEKRHNEELAEAIKKEAEGSQSVPPPEKVAPSAAPVSPASEPPNEKGDPPINQRGKITFDASGMPHCCGRRMTFHWHPDVFRCGECGHVLDELMAQRFRADRGPTSHVPRETSEQPDEAATETMIESLRSLVAEKGTPENKAKLEKAIKRLLKEREQSHV